MHSMPIRVERLHKNEKKQKKLTQPFKNIMFMLYWLLLWRTIHPVCLTDQKGTTVFRQQQLTHIILCCLLTVLQISTCTLAIITSVEVCVPTVSRFTNYFLVDSSKTNRCTSLNSNKQNIPTVTSTLICRGSNIEQRKCIVLLMSTMHDAVTGRKAVFWNPSMMHQ